MQPLLDPAVRTNTKLSCINQINSVAQLNPLALIWSLRNPWLRDEEFNNKWCNSAKAGTTKETLKYVNMKSLPSPTTLCKPIINQTMYVLTGHGPFRSHLARLQLVDEPSYPNCGSHEDTSMHFLLNCPKFHGIRKSHLTAYAKSFIIDHWTPTCQIIASTFMIWQIM